MQLPNVDHDHLHFEIVRNLEFSIKHFLLHPLQLYQISQPASEQSAVFYLYF